MSRSGGATCYETVDRIMRKLCDDGVLKQFSLLGRKKKRNFSLTEMYKVVLGEFV